MSHACIAGYSGSEWPMADIHPTLKSLLTIEEAMSAETEQAEFQEIDRSLPQCSQGSVSFDDGLAEEHCPYPMGDHRRTLWLTGWYDARARLKHKDLFAEHGVEYP